MAVPTGRIVKLTHLGLGDPTEQSSDGDNIDIPEGGVLDINQGAIVAAGGVPPLITLLNLRRSLATIPNLMDMPIPFPYYHTLTLMLSLNLLLIAYSMIEFETVRATPPPRARRSSSS